MSGSSATIKLASGYEMPLVGFGLWKVPRDATADTVYNAIKIGYRLLDGAYDYQNEREAGEGVKRAIADGLVKREELFITSKLWNNYHKKEHVVEMAERQLGLWGLEYFDLFLVHFPISLEYIEPEKREYPCWWMDDKGTISPAKVPLHETWGAMESLVDRKLVRSIGVSNFTSQLLADLLSYAKHPVSSLQIEHHPFLAQPDLIAFAQENNIAVTGYSSFGPQSFRELGGKISQKVDGVTLLEHEVVNAIAGKHGKTAGQVLLRWATQRGVAVIPKSVNEGRAKENLENVSFDLSKEEIDSISALNVNLRFNDPGFYLDPPIRIFA